MFKALIKTLPSLTGNFKLACRIDHFTKTYKENNIQVFETNIQRASLQPLQNKVFNKNININLIDGQYEHDVKYFYNKYINLFYSENYTYLKDDFERYEEIVDNKYSRNKDYEFGCKRISYFNTGYQYEFFCPIYIDNFEDLPKYLDITILINKYICKKIRININKQESTNYLYRYLDRYLRKIDNKVIFINNENKQMTYFGINVKNGGFVSIKDNKLKDFYTEQLPINEFNKTINEGFERNNLIIKQIIPLAFQFNISDILSEEEKKKFSFVKVQNISAIYCNPLNLPFYDIDTNHDTLYKYYISFDTTYKGDVIRHHSMENILNQSSILSLKEKYLKEYSYDKITSNYNHWVLAPNNEYNYYTNMSYNYTLENTKQYGEFPNINNLKEMYLETSKGNNVDLFYLLNNGVKNDEGILNEKNYKSNLEKFINSWYTLINDENLNTIFNQLDYWSIPVNNYGYYKGILYDLNNTIITYNLPNIDYFAIFVKPYYNICNNINRVYNIPSCITNSLHIDILDDQKENFNNQNQKFSHYNFKTNQFDFTITNTSSKQAILQNNLNFIKSTYDFENKIQYTPFLQEDTKYIDLYELKYYIENYTFTNNKKIIYNKILEIFFENLSNTQKTSNKLDINITIGNKVYSHNINLSDIFIISNDNSIQSENLAYILLDRIYLLKNLETVIKNNNNYNIISNLYYKYKYDINKVSYSSNPITDLNNENISWFLKTKLISLDILKDILNIFKDEFNNYDISIHDNLLDNLTKYYFVYDWSYGHYFKRYDICDNIDFDVYFDYRFASDVKINYSENKDEEISLEEYFEKTIITDYTENIPEAVNNRIDGLLEYGYVQIKGKNQLSFLVKFGNDFKNHLENFSLDDLKNKISIKLYKDKYYWREVDENLEKFKPEFPLYLYFSIPLLNTINVEDPNTSNIYALHEYKDMFGLVLYEKLINYIDKLSDDYNDFIKPINKNYICLEDIEYYKDYLFKIDFFKNTLENINKTINKIDKTLTNSNINIYLILHNNENDNTDYKKQIIDFIESLYNSISLYELNNNHIIVNIISKKLIDDDIIQNIKKLNITIINIIVNPIVQQDTEEENNTIILQELFKIENELKFNSHEFNYEVNIIQEFKDESGENTSNEQQDQDESEEEYTFNNQIEENSIVIAFNNHIDDDILLDIDNYGRYNDNDELKNKNIYCFDLRFKYNKYGNLQDIPFNIYYNAPLCKINKNILDNIIDNTNKAYYLVYKDKYNYYDSSYLTYNQYENYIEDSSEDSPETLLKKLTIITDINISDIYSPLYNNPYKENDEINYQKNLINNHIYYKKISIDFETNNNEYQYEKYNINLLPNNRELKYIKTDNPYQRYYSINVDQIIYKLSLKIYYMLFDMVDNDDKFIIESNKEKIMIKINLVKTLFFYLNIITNDTIYNSNFEILQILGLYDNDKNFIFNGKVQDIIKYIYDIEDLDESFVKKIDYMYLYYILRTYIDIPLQETLNKYDEIYLHTKKIIFNIIHKFDYLFNSNLNFDDLIDKEFYNQYNSNNPYLSGESYNRFKMNSIVLYDPTYNQYHNLGEPRRNIFTSIFINIIYGHHINKVRKLEYNNLIKGQLNISYGYNEVGEYQTTLQSLINNLLYIFKITNNELDNINQYNDGNILITDSNIQNLINDYKINDIDPLYGPDDIKYSGIDISIDDNKEEYNDIDEVRNSINESIKANYLISLRLFLKYLYNIDKSLLVSIINRYDLELFEDFNYQDWFGTHELCKKYNGMNIYTDEKTKKTYGFILYQPYIDNTDITYNISNNVLFSKINDYELTEKIFYHYFNDLVPYMKTTLFSTYLNKLYNYEYIMDLYKINQKLKLKSVPISNNLHVNIDKIDTYNMFNFDKKENTNNGGFVKSLYENSSEHKLINGNNSNITIFRYTNFIRPAFNLADTISLYELKYKSISNQFGVDNIFIRNNVLNNYSGIDVFNNVEKSKIYNNQNISHIYEKEYKHFNANSYFILPPRIEITLEKPILYNQLLEYETKENSIKIFKKYTNLYQNIQLSENEILFLFNKYKLDYESNPVLLEFNKTKKLYQLKYIFTIL